MTRTTWALLLLLPHVDAFSLHVRRQAPLKNIRPLPLQRMNGLQWCQGAAADNNGDDSFLPCGDALDQQIGRMLLPSVANLAVVPLTGAVDTFWVGRMGDALALAGQGAANQVFNAFFFVCSFVPKVTVPLVARAHAAGDVEGARDRTCDSIFVACVIGLLGTILLVGFPQAVLRTVVARRESVRGGGEEGVSAPLGGWCSCH